MTENEPKDPDPFLQVAREEKDFASGKVSDLCRYFGLAYLALSYSVLISDNKVPTQIVTEHSNILFFLGLSGALTVFLDFVQYISAYIQSISALKNENHKYMVGIYWPSTIIRNFSFIAKQLATLIGAVFLVIFSIEAFSIALS